MTVLRTKICRGTPNFIEIGWFPAGWDIAIKPFSKWRPSAILNLQNLVFWSRYLCLNVILLLRTKFRINRTINRGDIAKRRFSIWLPSAILNLKNVGILLSSRPWSTIYQISFFFLGPNPSRGLFSIEETPGRILTRNGSKDAEPREEVPFWGYKMKNWNLTTIYPQNPKIWPRIRNFQPKWWNMKLEVCQKVLNQSRWKFNTMLGT